MQRVLRLSVVAVSLSVLSGCMTMKSYVDPGFHKAGYGDIQRMAQPIPVNVITIFQRNGQGFPAADGELRGHVERTLRATGAFVPATADTRGTITVTGNNIADLAAARAKGFATGLTFGGAGSTVDDNYEFSCKYKAGDAEKSFTYQHILHSTIGNAQAPAGLTATTPAAGFGTIVEDVMLNFVKDLQDSGVIPKQ